MKLLGKKKTLKKSLTLTISVGYMVRGLVWMGWVFHCSNVRVAFLLDLCRIFVQLSSVLTQTSP